MTRFIYSIFLILTASYLQLSIGASFKDSTELKNNIEFGTISNPIITIAVYGYKYFPSLYVNYRRKIGKLTFLRVGIGSRFSFIKIHGSNSCIFNAGLQNTHQIGKGPFSFSYGLDLVTYTEEYYKPGFAACPIISFEKIIANNLALITEFAIGPGYGRNPYLSGYDREWRGLYYEHRYLGLGMKFGF